MAFVTSMRAAKQTGAAAAVHDGAGTHVAAAGAAQAGHHCGGATAAAPRPTSEDLSSTVALEAAAARGAVPADRPSADATRAATQGGEAAPTPATTGDHDAVGQSSAALSHVGRASPASTPGPVDGDAAGGSARPTAVESPRRGVPGAG